jgi:hypothetical protein
MRKEKLEIF